MKTKQNEDKDNVFSVVEHWSFLLQIFLISSQISGSMASLHLGAASLINESWVVFGSSLRLRIGFRSKRFRRVAERWMFCVQQMSVKDQMTKQELARSAKRSESLRYILKQYGVSVENPEENSRLDDLNCEAKHDAVPSSVIDDSKMKTIEELPDLRQEEKYSETASTVDNLSGHQHHKFPHLNTGALFTSLLPALVFCIVCIIGTLHTIISRKTSRGHHHRSKRTRWRTALSDWDEPLASDEHDSSPEYRVGSANQEATDEVNEAYSRVELEYKRFLLECGVSES